MKRYCPQNHDTLVVGRRKSGMCAQCDRDRKRYDKMTPEQVELEKRRKFLMHIERLKDPIRIMKKQTKERLRRYEQSR